MSDLDKNALTQSGAEIVNAEPTEQQFQQLNLKEIGLTEQDFAQVIAARKELADMNHMAVAEYGKNIATKTATYTDELLNLVKNKDLDTTGQKLNEVVQVAQQLNTSNILNKPKNSGFLGNLFGKIKGAKQNFDQQFNTTKEQIDALVKEIETSQSGLKARVDTLDRMFNGVQEEYKQLGVYIAAGRLKQQEIQQDIAHLTTQEQDQNTSQKLYDLNHVANNLEKRVSDLHILQQSAMQTLPMIRIIQSNNLMLVDKFYAIKNITLSGTAGTNYDSTNKSWLINTDTFAPTNKDVFVQILNVDGTTPIDFSLTRQLSASTTGAYALKARYISNKASPASQTVKTSINYTLEYN